MGVLFTDLKKICFFLIYSEIRFSISQITYDSINGYMCGFPYCKNIAFCFLSFLSLFIK